MNEIELILTADGELFDLTYFGESILEFLPTVYKVDVGKKSYYIDDDEFIKSNTCSKEIVIHLFSADSPIKTSRLDENFNLI